MVIIGFIAGDEPDAPVDGERARDRGSRVHLRVRAVAVRCPLPPGADDRWVDEEFGRRRRRDYG